MDEKPQPELRWDGVKAAYCDAQGVERWTVVPSEIALIAEYTTSAGPADDYFLVIWTIEQGVLMSVQCPLEGTAENVLRELAKVLGFVRDASLVQSTVWDSMVVWPLELAGEDYFTYTTVKTKHWWGALFHRVMETKKHRVSDHVMGFLREKRDRMAAEG
jgi:hypothetical protein